MPKEEILVAELVKLMIPDMLTFNSNSHLIIIYYIKPHPKPNQNVSVPWKMILKLPLFCILQSDLLSCLSKGALR